MTETHTEQPNGEPVDMRDLVAECLDRIEHEGSAAVDDMCARHPQRATELRRRLDLLRQTGLLDSEPQAIPERLGEFRLLRKLGAGGMGVVYLAEQETLHRVVALKLVRPELAYFEPTRERFRREILSASRLDHPGIVKVHAVGEHGGIAYYAMEYVRGCSLADVLATLVGGDPAHLTGRDFARAVAARVPESNPDEVRAAFPGTWVETCVRLVQQTAVALDHAHQHGVLHRDVKPSNLLVTPAGRVVLVDFGLAALEGSGKLTRTGQLPGSPDYMAPEQVRGAADAVDRRTDVYALGVTLYELLALQSPFSTTSLEATCARILAGAPPAVRTCNRAVSRDLEIVCQQAMDVDPGRRYPSAADLARDLDNLLALRPIEARPAGLTTRLSKWMRRHPARAVASALAGVLVVFGPLTVAALERSAARQVLQQKAEADINFDLARDAVKQMLGRIRKEDMAEIVNLDPVRRELLQDALRFHRTFLDKRTNDPTVCVEAADAYAQVGSIELLLGRVQESTAAFEEAERLFNLLPADRIEQPAILLAWLDTRQGYGEALRQSGEADRALVVFERALELLSQKGSQLNDYDRAVMGARSRVLLGSALERDKRLDEAEQCIATATTDLERVVAENPKDAQAQHVLGTTWCLRGNIAFGRKDMAEAEQALLRSCQAFEAAVEASPRSLRLRVSLAGAIGNLGSVQLALRRETALAAIERAVHLLDGIVAEVPMANEFRRSLAFSIQTLAESKHAQGDLKAALSLLERALAESAEAVRLRPSEDNRQRTRLIRDNLLDWMRQDGRYEEAARLAIELPNHEPERWQSWFAAAVHLVECIQCVAHDESLAPPESAARRDSYSASAVTNLRQAVARGMPARFVKHLERGCLGDRADFRELVAGLTEAK